MIAFVTHSFVGDYQTPLSNDIRATESTACSAAFFYAILVLEL